MPEQKNVRVEIAFVGGQIMSSFVSSKSATALETALKDGSAGPTLTLESNEGPLTVVLAHVVYAKRFPPEGRIGFVAP